MADKAIFNSISTLLEARVNKSFNLSWYYTDAPSPSNPYTKIRIYRYIGPKTSCGRPSGGVTNQYVYPEKEDPDNSAFTITSNIINTTSFTDDLSPYDSFTSTTLITQHGLTDASNDKQVIHEILYSQRPIYYFIESYKETSITTEYFDALPYVIVARTFDNAVDAYSAFTQVKHDVLNFEGDIRWSSFVFLASFSFLGLSRTSVDVNTFLRNEPLQQGPTGRGGYVWCSDRGTGNVFRFCLNNGLNIATYNTPHGKANVFSGRQFIRGLGISVDPNTGDCWAGVMRGAEGSPWGIFKLPARNDPADDDTTFTINWNVHTPNNIFATGNYDLLYGLVPIPGNPNLYAISTFRPRLLLFDSSAKTIVNERDYTSTGSPENYGIGVGADKIVWHGMISQGKVFGRDVFSNANYSFNTGIQGTSITCSIPGLYPNADDEYQVIGGNGGFNIFQISITGWNQSTKTPSSTNYRDWNFAPELEENDPFAGVIRGTQARGVGVDSSNGVWAVGTAVGKWYQNESGTEYPLQGDCTYPNIPLSGWPDSTTNTREIEWFLLRNGYDKTLEGARSSLVGIPIKNVSISSSLDDTVAVNWTSGRTETAKAAFDAMIADFHGQGAQDGRIATNYTKLNLGGWRPYFHSGKQSSNTKQFGIRLYESRPDNTSIQGSRVNTIVSLIEEWSDAFANWSTSYIGDANRNTRIANNLQTLKLYPHYSDAMSQAGTKNGTMTFGCYRGFSYQYSDFTGNGLASFEEETITTVQSNVDRINPTTIPPSAYLGIIQALHSSPLSEDLTKYPWNEIQSGSNLLSPIYLGTNTLESITGYDDLTVEYYVCAEPGTFVIDEWELQNSDHLNDYGNPISNEQSEIISTNLITKFNGDYDNDQLFSHIFNDPSKHGLTGNLVFDGRNNTLLTGSFSAIAYAKTNADPYSCANVDAESNIVDVIITERWPETRLFIEHESLSSNRFNWLPPGDCNHAWEPSARFNKESDILFGYSNSNPRDDMTIAFGVDPISANIHDSSISRTYPISSWSISISTNNVWSEELQSNWTNEGGTYPLVTSFNVTLDSNADTSIDQESINTQITNNFWRYGTYKITLTVEASNTSTEGANEYSEARSSTQFLSVAEFEPFANFWAISASTVSPSYSEETRSVQASDLILPDYAHLPNDTVNLVSGYAPNLTVWFLDSSVSHTFPISSYHWNYGDYYDELNNTDTWIVTSHSGDFDNGCWQTDKQNGIANHTYVMPGFYDVTLTVEASNTSTPDVCGRYVDVTRNDTVKFYVYVQEIDPQCCYAISNSPSGGFTENNSLTGISPYTIYALASCITPGSFPICKISYDWGDNTASESITRSPFVSTTNLGNMISAASAIGLETPFPDDPFDPRNFVIQHTYNTSIIGGKTFYPTLSVFACNTNTLAICESGHNIMVTPLTEEILEPRHLIGSRFLSEQNDIMYAFEGVDFKTTYYIALCSDIFIELE